MKPAILLAIAIITLSSLPIFSRHDDAVAQQNASMHDATVIGQPGASRSTDPHGDERSLAVDADHCAAAEMRQENGELHMLGANQSVAVRDKAASRPTCASAENSNGSLQTNTQKISSLASSQ